MDKSHSNSWYRFKLIFCPKTMNTHDFSAPLRHISKDGNAYGRPTHYSDDELTKVGPQTPCGEMMRRYWHPVACSKDVGSTPQNVRVLGEDLILFRDGKELARHEGAMAKPQLQAFVDAHL